MNGYPAKVRELTWDAGSRFLATGGGPVVTIWDCGGRGPAGSRPLELKGHQDSISALTYQHRGPLLASGGKDGRICIWNSSRDRRVRQGIGMKAPVTGLAWSPDDRLLPAATAHGHVVVFQPVAAGV